MGSYFSFGVFVPSLISYTTNDGTGMLHRNQVSQNGKNYLKKLRIAEEVKELTDKHSQIVYHK
jgi:hypothetical protein